MKEILITGTGSYVDENVRKYILAKEPSSQIDVVDTMGITGRGRIMASMEGKE